METICFQRTKTIYLHYTIILELEEFEFRIIVQHDKLQHDTLTRYEFT